MLPSTLQALKHPRVNKQRSISSWLYYYCIITAVNDINELKNGSTLTILKKQNLHGALQEFGGGGASQVVLLVKNLPAMQET